MSLRNTHDTDAPSIALVGCGAVAELFYLPAFVRRSSLASRLILVDVNLGRAKAMASKFRINSYVEDYRDILLDVDGAIIALPHQLHYEVAMDFLRSGVHVLCEKPLTETAEQARLMVQEAERNSISLCVNNTRRLFPSSKKIKELLEDETIGEPLDFRLEEGGEYNWPTVSGFYFKSGESNYGVLMDRGPHVIDLLCWWLDSKPSITCYMDDSFGGREAVAALDFRIKGSVNGSIKLSWLSRLKNKCVIRGEDGVLICGVYDWRQVTLYKNDRLFKIHPPSPQRYFSDFALEIIDNFSGVIQKREDPLVTGKDVVNSIAVIEACYKNRKTFPLPWIKAR